MRRALPAALAVLALASVAAGCGAGTSTGSARAASDPACPKAWGWQRLANRIHADVYCPRWMPAPFTGQIQGDISFGGTGGYRLSVSKDRSYLALFIWAEPQTGELHVNIRGYPGRTAIPTCLQQNANQGKLITSRVPCFADRRGTVRENGITATVYTANQDADLWHVLYLWRHAGGLYTISEHVAEPLTYKMVVANLNRMLQNLALVHPQTG